MSRSAAVLAVAVAAAALVGAAGCRLSEPEGLVRSDGSSTVFPVAEALAEDYARAGGRSRVVVGRSGTGGGVSRLCSGEIDIAHASRPLTDAERALCRDAGIEPLVLPVAFDGVSVVTHPDNGFVDCLTLDELRRIWEPNSPVRRWRDVRPEFPDRPLELFGAGPGSGTFDTFTRAVVGRMGASRTDYQASEDDNVLVQGVAGDSGALGYFGYGYVVEHRDRLKLLAVDGGAGCVRPDPASIASGVYTPLARSLYVVVAADALRRRAVTDYLVWFLDHAADAVTAVGYVPLEAGAYADLRRRVAP